MIVYQAYCGGSGCKDLANYGIINADSLEVYLVPNDLNKNIASQLLGEEVHPIPAKKMINIERLVEKTNK